MKLSVFTNTEINLFAHLDNCNIFSAVESILLVLALEEECSISNLLLQLGNKTEAER